MAEFKTLNFSIRTGILAKAGPNKILTVELKGVHDHHWPHGAQVRRIVEEEVRQIKPAAVLFDFLDYRYDSGNEIGEPIMTAYIASAPQLIRQMAIVATGSTASSLKSLFVAGMWEKLFNLGFYEDIASGREFLRRALEEKKG